MRFKRYTQRQLCKAIEELKRLEGDEAMRDLYEAWLDQVRVLATELRGSFEEGTEEGLEKGLEQGIEQARSEIARRLLQEGTAAELVARLTGLEVDAVRALRKN